MSTTSDISNIGVSCTSSVSTVSTVEPSHLLYLYPYYSPGTVIVSTTFNGLGYGSWRRGMLIRLSCKNKLGLINGMIPKPSADSPLYEPWCRCNDTVTAWFLDSLDMEIRESVMYTESAEKLWKEIEQRYGKPNGSKVFQIRKEISSISQGSSNIASYFNRIKKLWDELAFSISYPPCVCGCKEAFQKIEEDQKVHQFLMDLNENYSNVRRNILMMKPLPDIDTVYAILIEDESQTDAKTSVPSFSSESASFSTAVQKPISTGVQKPYSQRVNFDPSRKFNSNLICKYYKKPGHSIEKCYKLHGYPPGSRIRLKKNVACAQVCDSQVAVHFENSGTDGSKVPQTDVGGYMLTKEQYDQLISFIQQFKISSAAQDFATGSANFAGMINSTTTSSDGIVACNVSSIESGV
ncbi:PREDICTED: uncharacterized protein LOC109235846 [Nicotiana attenuata]|uniref:uncharacterized protein LOC109235846 n=1 Tax=Nicotiana attenuata TaxID=49451 RepID=UPI000905C743|nr:PREDICTED: uncharacterized protein LOC109235846 [Nicotiana attenuata]